MNEETKEARQKTELTGTQPALPPYEPPAIIWEEELSTIAAHSCVLDPLGCEARVSA